MKKIKKSFISVMSVILKYMILICMFTALTPTMNVRAEGEMVSLSRCGTSQLGYYLDPDGHCVVSTQSSVLLKFYHTYEMIFPINI